ncbi:MAG: UDP-N-acetylmuramoyl-L-alanyl-D-glutamate--2,6-diaminopimelate ligase [Candidatus Omnitrophica bacterium]|nr:UDP-N-acetylmuramoyl-L-alanyl-D-glutamate--2,6-diaminopimelate ligase [Candidatus Omnitrophota bacterium]
MKIKSLIKSLDILRPLKIKEDFEVKGIACNSKGIKPGYLFVAIKGNKDDGNKFIEEAIKNGANCIVAQVPGAGCQVSEKTCFIEVKDARKALAKLAAQFYGHPSGKMKVIGITGTNGKTTVTYLLEAILKANQIHPAVIGTINYRFKNKIIPAKNTTPGPLELQLLFYEMGQEGVEYAIMEVSSHALAQERTAGIKFQSAIFTNLTQDHLDYHLTMEEYFSAKSRLFKDCSPSAIKIINNDDAFGRRIKEEVSEKIITYGIENKSDYMAQDLKLGIKESEFTLSGPQMKEKIKTKLIGRHNVLNILAAVSWANQEGIDPQVIRNAIERFPGVPGRLERVDSRKDYAIYVDYAHTDDALKNVILSLKQISSQKLIVVFGCGGERDKGKRPKMGKVVTELADYAIITSDNPRSEDPDGIIKDIVRGIHKDNYCIIPGRKEAIKKALSIAAPGDIVLIAGKGHENYQIFKDQTIHFDDREVVTECLNVMS